jgi:hypothetical protein
MNDFLSQNPVAGSSIDNVHFAPATLALQQVRVLNIDTLNKGVAAVVSSDDSDDELEIGK